MFRVCCNCTLPEEIISEYKEKFILECPTNGKAFETATDLCSRLNEYEGLLVAGLTVKEDILQHGERLKAIANIGVGYDNIDVENASRRKIAVINTPDSVTEATAELTMAILLCAVRCILPLDRKVREQGTFPPLSPFPIGVGSLYGKTLGIIGMGRIGKAVARRAVAFGMRVVYNNPHKIDARGLDATPVSLEGLLNQADVISIHCPSTPQNYHLVNEDFLSRVKPGAVLVNAARGDLINENALVESLKSGRLSAVALDVFEHEPKVHPELLQMNQVVLSPHIGTYAYDIRLEMVREALDGLYLVLNGQSARNVVNKDVLIQERQS